MPKLQIKKTALIIMCVIMIFYWGIIHVILQSREKKTPSHPIESGKNRDYIDYVPGKFPDDNDFVVDDPMSDNHTE